MKAIIQILCASVFISIMAFAASGDFYFPGDYEKHEAIWLSWPTFENKIGKPSTTPILEIIRALNGHVKVHLIIEDEEDRLEIENLAGQQQIQMDHVKFFPIEHEGIWARDMGPQFVKNAEGKLAIVDWNFDIWGYESANSPSSLIEEAVDRNAAKLLGVPVIDVASKNAKRLIHEGGAVVHNGHRTMIAVESVVMQRALGPDRFCGGGEPRTNLEYPSSYEPNPGWEACKKLVEVEYQRLLGVKKIIWVPTGVIEDQGTFRGALGKQFHVKLFEKHKISSPGVYPLFATNGHADEFVRFVSEDTVLLAETHVPKLGAHPTTLERLVHYLEIENKKRLDNAYQILSQSTTNTGKPLKIIRMPTPTLHFEVFEPGDELYGYFHKYTRWEDKSKLGPNLFGVLPASYMNYLPTNGVVLLPKFWKPGRSKDEQNKDAQAEKIIKAAFPGRKVVRIDVENLNLGGGGIHCITQQQPL